MSAVRSLALGSLLLTLAVDSSLGGSIHSKVNDHHQRPGRTSSAPTSIVFESPGTFPNAAHSIAAENLAATSTNAVSSYPNSPISSSTPPSSAHGLFLGISNGNSGASSYSASTSVNQASNSLGTPQNGLNPTYSLPSPAPAVSVSTAPSIPAAADAFINFGSEPYPEASTLTTGTPQAFFHSPVFTHFFGSGGPSSTNIANFEQEVLAQIKSTYHNAGLPITLTTDPSSPASHTLSVVSGASYAGNIGAIGITDVGNNGFSFIDKFGGTQTVDQLAIAIGNNISHELMHAFGIANHPEQTGPYVDAATSTLQTLTDPSTGFSSAAASLLSTLNFQAVGQSVLAGTQLRVDGDQILTSASAVPEPSTVALWVVVGALAIAYHRRIAA